MASEVPGPLSMVTSSFVPFAAFAFLTTVRRMSLSPGLTSRSGLYLGVAVASAALCARFSVVFDSAFAVEETVTVTVDVLVTVLVFVLPQPASTATRPSVPRAAAARAQVVAGMRRMVRRRMRTGSLATTR
jgi:hypothetical protein